MGQGNKQLGPIKSSTTQARKHASTQWHYFSKNTIADTSSPCTPMMRELDFRAQKTSDSPDIPNAFHYLLV